MTEMTETGSISSLTATPQETLALREIVGMRIVEPTATEVFIDIDNRDDLEAYLRGRQVLEANGIEFDEIRHTPSSTPGHFHLVVSIPDIEMTPLMRIALQACLGSDRKRELLALLRIHFGVDCPTSVFFEPIEETSVATDIEDTDIPF